MTSVTPLKTGRAVSGLLFVCVSFILFAACDDEVSKASARLGKTASISDDAEKKLVLSYFYEELCASCDGTEAFRAAAEKELAGVRDTYPYEIRTVNVFGKEGRALWQQEAAGYGIDPAEIELPVLLAGGKMFQGETKIRENLREAYLTAGEDLFVYEKPYQPGPKKTGAALFEDIQFDSAALTLVYFYRAVCEECGQTAPLIDALPKTTAAGLPVNVIRLNTRSGDNAERIAAFFAAYAVPDEDRKVPIVFTGNGYLSGFDAIEAGLPSSLSARSGFAFLEGLRK